MFGAWQAGAWLELATRFKPDFIVGASVGSLNGYAIATGWTPDELCDFWMQEGMVGFRHLAHTTQLLISRPLQKRFGVVLVDLVRMKPRTFQDSEVTWRHLFASCAVPGVISPLQIDGRYYLDGGLLNPLPVWAAVELGATEIIALNALPEIPSVLLKPFVRAFRAVFGHHPPLPAGVSLATLAPSRNLGSLTDAVRWNRENVTHWIQQGKEDAKNISIPKCIER
jgi:predicted acylesterase/phospholipase RssA